MTEKYNDIQKERNLEKGRDCGRNIRTYRKR